MTTDYKILETIDNYLSGNMTDQERMAFENQITIDPDLAEMVLEIKQTNEAIHFANLAFLKENIASDIKKIKYRPGPSKLVLYSIMVLGIVAIATTYFILKNNDVPVSSENNKSILSEQNPLPVIQETEPEKPLDTEKIPETSTKTHIKNEVENRITIPKAAENHTSPVSEDTTTSSQSIGVTSGPDSVPSGNIPQVRQEQDNATSNSGTSPDSPVLCTENFDFKATPTCRNQNTGSVKVNAIGGGLRSFEIADLGLKNTNGIFSNLHSGNFEVRVTYGRGCVLKELVVIEEIWCPLNSAFSFNPDYGEKWNILFEDGDYGTFTIFNKFGKEIYSDTFNSRNSSWDGRDKNGNIVYIGTYIAIINYSDGRIEKVDLTIVR